MIAGSPAKPAEGTDGMRVPLLRPGFRPEGPYTISFVYLHAGPAFAKKGDMQMTLPRMDVPVSVVEWELFLPAQSVPIDSRERRSRHTWSTSHHSWRSAQ